MKKAYILLSWAFLFAILSACKGPRQPGGNPDAVQQEILEQEEEVRTTLIQMWDAIENEDIELYASFIHPDFTQFGETDPELKIGKEAEISGTRQWIRDSKNIHTEMEEPRVVIKDSVAWITYYWKDHGTTHGEAFASRGKSTRIFVKEDGRWLCIHGHYTLLP